MNEPTEPAVGDAFGEGLLAVLEGRTGYSVVNERDDGFVDVDTADYFASVFDDPTWPWIERHVEGRILDIGAGAGRAAVPLQNAGADVTALDVSAGAIAVCERRGVTDTFRGDVRALAANSGHRFDTFLCMGNNLGLIGSPDQAGEFFAALRQLGRPGSRPVGTMLNPYESENPAHLRYHEANRANGKMAGEVWLRTRFQRLATPWFGLLWLAPHELADIAARTGWEVTDATEGLIYAAALRPR